MRKHDHLPLAIQVYKKALLALKLRFKNDYLSMGETARVLIQIASTEYMRGPNKESLNEAVKYYEHALGVLG